ARQHRNDSRSGWFIARQSGVFQPFSYGILPIISRKRRLFEVFPAGRAGQIRVRRYKPVWRRQIRNTSYCTGIVSLVLKKSSSKISIWATVEETKKLGKLWSILAGC